MYILMQLALMATSNDYVTEIMLKGLGIFNNPSLSTVNCLSLLCSDNQKLKAQC